MTTDRGEIQESQYTFPYHYLPHFEKDGVPQVSRSLGWGWDFLSYMDFVVCSIQNLNPESLLDVGCGDGYMVNTLNNRNVDFSLKGVDISERAIAFANAFCTAEKMLFQTADIFSYEEKHDIVSMIEVIEHIPDDILPKFLEKVFSIAKKYVVISVPTTVLPQYAKHYRHYDENLMTEQMAFASDDFEIYQQKRIYRDNKKLKFFRRLFFNRFFEIRHSGLNKALWSWHKKNTYFATPGDGYHLVTIYKRK